jgi:hypothetical protein
MAKYRLVEVVAALREHHGLLVLTAEALGCSRSTLQNYAKQYPVIAETIIEEREKLIDLAERGLYEHLMERSPWAIALTLKTLGKGRGYSEQRPMADTPHGGEAEEWQAIQTTLFKALQAYPEARLAVVEALKALEPHASQNGSHLGA